MFAFSSIPTSCRKKNTRYRMPFVSTHYRTELEGQKELLNTHIMGGVDDHNKSISISLHFRKRKT